MPASYNGNASNATGTQVTITNPVDGDTLNAASATIFSKLLADWGQRFLNYLLNATTIPAGLTVHQSTTNADGIDAVGNGTGAGLSATGGSNGLGISGTAGGSNNLGVLGTGSGSGSSACGVAGVGGSGGAPGVQATAGGSSRGALQVVPQATPGSPVNGDIWVDTTRNTLAAKINSIVVPSTPVVVGSGGSAPAYKNSWTSVPSGSGPARFWLDSNGVVHLSGSIYRTIHTTSVAFTLPAGYLPATFLRNFVTTAYSNTSGSFIAVDYATGNVTAVTGTDGDWCSLDGITFETY